MSKIDVKAHSTESAAALAAMNGGSVESMTVEDVKYAVAFGAQACDGQIDASLYHESTSLRDQTEFLSVAVACGATSITFSNPAQGGSVAATFPDTISAEAAREMLVALAFNRDVIAVEGVTLAQPFDADDDHHDCSLDNSYWDEDDEDGE